MRYHVPQMKFPPNALALMARPLGIVLMARLLNEAPSFVLRGLRMVTVFRKQIMQRRWCIASFFSNLQTTITQETQRTDGKTATKETAAYTTRANYA